MGTEGQILSSLPQAAARALYVYEVPPGTDARVALVGLVKLTPEEEKQAIDSAGGSGGGAILEQVKWSLRMVARRSSDGNHLRRSVQVGAAGEGSAGLAMDEMEPALRNMIRQRFLKLHTASDADAESFQKSERIEAV